MAHTESDVRDVVPAADEPRESVWSVLLAAGSGSRFGALKQFEMLGDRQVIEWSLEVLVRHSEGVVLVVPPGTNAIPDGVTGSLPESVTTVSGGETRSESVRRALQAIPDEATIVCVHDAARPFVPDAVVHAVLDAVRAGADGAVPGVEVADTIKSVDDLGNVTGTPERARLRAVQTPQAFRAAVLSRAHSFGAEATDDAALVERGGGRVVVVPGDAILRKITTRDDLRWASQQALRWTEGEI